MKRKSYFTNSLVILDLENRKLVVVLDNQEDFKYLAILRKLKVEKTRCFHSFYFSTTKTLP